MLENKYCSSFGNIWLDEKNLTLYNFNCTCHVIQRFCKHRKQLFSQFFQYFSVHVIWSDNHKTVIAYNWVTYLLSRYATSGISYGSVHRELTIDARRNFRSRSNLKMPPPPHPIGSKRPPNREKGSRKMKCIAKSPLYSEKDPQQEKK